MPRTSRPLSIFPIILREAEVSRIEDLTPAMRRLTLSGPELQGLTRDGHTFGPFRSEGFDDHVKLVLPDADGTLPHVGTQEEHRFDWAPGTLTRTRDYTVRSVAADGASFTIDVVRHDAGLASDWAFSCGIGDRVAFAGPKSSAGTVEADWHLLLGDETALPAIARWLEEAPAGTRARVIIEVPTAADIQELTTGAEAEITWLTRDGIPAGHSGQLLQALEATRLPAGRGYAWCAGETVTMVPIRRHLRREMPTGPRDVEVVGYWRRMTAAPETSTAQSGGAAETGAVETGPTESPLELQLRLHEMSELLPPIALRAAVTLGLPALLASGGRTPADLAAATAVPPERLDPLLDALRALDVLRADGPRRELTALGEALGEESAQEDLDLADPVNRAELALLGVVDVLRTGEVPTTPMIPGPLHRWRATDPEADTAFTTRVEDTLQWSLPPLCALPEVQGAQEITLVGDGTVPTAIALIAQEPSRRVHLVAPAHAADRARRRLQEALPTAQAAQVDVVSPAPNQPLPGCDTAIDQHALDGAADAEAQTLAHALTAAARAHVVVVTEPADAAAEDDHVAAASLTALATGGTALRTTEASIALLRAAGARHARFTELGWGFGPGVILATTGAATTGDPDTAP